MMDLYPNLLSEGLLDHTDTLLIAQVLHTHLRHPSSDKKRTDMLSNVELIVTDIRRGALQPHYSAFVHLFSTYKACKRFNDGYRLWLWLIDQGEQWVSQAAYGAAIEMMAYGDIKTLPELEELYVDGLKRFPGTFAEYHLSPDAIVPDRTLPVNVPGICMTLFQGILTARILARDWKRAYIALDTALRLYPAQTPPRFFELFILERPVSESYTALMLACRAGVTLRPTHVTALTTKIRAAMTTTSSMAERVMLLRAMANAMYAYTAAGGRLEAIFVGIFVRSFALLLPEKKAGEDYQDEAAELRDQIVTTVHEIISGLLQAGMPPQVHHFESMASLAGTLRVPGLLKSIVQDTHTAGFKLEGALPRTFMTAASFVGDKPVLQDMWQRIVLAAETNSAHMNYMDWITFARACRRSGNVDYFRDQLLKLSHTVTERLHKQIVQQSEGVEPSIPGEDQFKYMTSDELRTEFEGLKTQTKNLEVGVMSGQAPDVSMTPFHMHLDPTHPQLGSTGYLRTIYNERTTDPHQPPPPPPVTGSPVKRAVSPTGIPLDELRFQNWVTVLEMMDDAEAYESMHIDAINAAIEAGKPVEITAEQLQLRKTTDLPLKSVEEVRLRVKSLRTSNPSEPRTSRKRSKH